MKRQSVRILFVVGLLAVALAVACSKKTPTAETSASPKASPSVTETATPSATDTAGADDTSETQELIDALNEQEIKTMQSQLNAVGCFVGAIDGSAGPNTIAGLKAFQRAAGLTVDGDYGPKTAAKLTSDASTKKVVCGAKPATRTPSAGSPPCTLAAVQAAVPNFKVGGYACSGGWAYVDPSGPSRKGQLLQASGTSWKVATCPSPYIDPNTGKPGPPPGSPIPRNIYIGGCVAG